MSVIWDRLISCQNEILDIFEANGKEIHEPGMDHFNQPDNGWINSCLLYTSPSPRDSMTSRMPSSA